jgi:hypothetical protein
MFSTYFYGTLKVLVDEASGAIMAVQSKLDGASASFTASPAYIAAAVDFAQRAHESQFSEA